MSRNDYGKTIDLFSSQGRDDNQISARKWPDQDRFPLNADGGNTVQKTVQRSDLFGSNGVLIVSGYAGLDRLIAFLCEAEDKNPAARIRLMFGHEPFPSRGLRTSASNIDLVREAEDFWLERGISLLYSANVIRALELLRCGQVNTRYMPGSRRLHAKIYVGDEAVTLGSSNFTEPGMLSQWEANARFTKSRRVRIVVASQ